MSTTAGIRGYDDGHALTKWDLPDHASQPLSVQAGGGSTLVTDMATPTADGNYDERTDLVDASTGSILRSLPERSTTLAGRGNTAVVVTYGNAPFPVAVLGVDTGTTWWTTRISDGQRMGLGTNAVFVGGGCATTIRD